MEGVLSCGAVVVSVGCLVLVVGVPFTEGGEELRWRFPGGDTSVVGGGGRSGCWGVDRWWSFGRRLSLSWRSMAANLGKEDDCF